MDYTLEDERCNAILQCWYSGQRGGKALADILFGAASPSAKLPVTFYKDGTQPPMEDYSMKGRTYRYYKDRPLYPFGYGLTYTDFEYSDLSIDGNTVSIKVKNTGNFEADEIVEVYIDKEPAEKLANGLNNIPDNYLNPNNQPYVGLCGFDRVTLKPGEEKVVNITIPEKSFYTVFENGSRAILKGEYTVFIGGQQPDDRSKELTGKSCLSVKFNK